MDRLTELLDAEEDKKKAQELAIWMLKYATGSILKISELNNSESADGDDSKGNITINQMLGRDPFK